MPWLFHKSVQSSHNGMPRIYPDMKMIYIIFHYFCSEIFGSTSLSYFIHLSAAGLIWGRRGASQSEADLEGVQNMSTEVGTE
jgi:hypothetical protein